MCKKALDDPKILQQAECTIRWKMINGNINDLTSTTEAINVWSALNDWTNFKETNTELAKLYETISEEFEKHKREKDELIKNQKFQYLMEGKSPTFEIENVTYYLTLRDKARAIKLGEELEKIVNLLDYNKKLSLVNKLLWSEGDFQLIAWKPDVKMLPINYGGYVMMACIKDSGTIINSNVAVSNALEGLLLLVNETTRSKWMSVIGWLNTNGKDKHIKNLCEDCPSLAFNPDDCNNTNILYSLFEHLTEDRMMLSGSNIPNSGSYSDIKSLANAIQKTFKFYTQGDMIGYIAGPSKNNINVKIATALEGFSKNLLKISKHLCQDNGPNTGQDLMQKETLMNASKSSEILATHVLFSAVHQNLRNKREELKEFLTKVSTAESWLLTSDREIRQIGDIDPKRWSFDQCRMRMGIILLSEITGQYGN